MEVTRGPRGTPGARQRFLCHVNTGVQAGAVFLALILLLSRPCPVLDVEATPQSGCCVVVYGDDGCLVNPEADCWM
jgi:hypothetical protein